jgi:hypothetical protein
VNRIYPVDGLSRTLLCTFNFYEMWGISLLDENYSITFVLAKELYAGSQQYKTLPRISVVFSTPVVLHYVSLMSDSSLPHLLERILLLLVIICVQMMSRSWIAAWGGVLLAYRPYYPILCCIKTKG